MSTAAFDALVGNRDHLESFIGFEPVSRAARLVLVKELNDEIAAGARRWGAADLALQQMGLDPGVGQVDVQPVATQNFHEGPHASLITSPPDRFPNISVAAYMTMPAPAQFQLDQADTNDLTLFVESMAIAGPVPAGSEVAYETIVHRRIQRMTEAAAAVMRRSGTLLGTVSPIALPPRGGIGNASWLRREGKGAGARYLWQGSRLQYTLQRFSALS